MYNRILRSEDKAIFRIDSARIPPQYRLIVDLLFWTESHPPSFHFISVLIVAGDSIERVSEKRRAEKIHILKLNKIKPLKLNTFNFRYDLAFNFNFTGSYLRFVAGSYLKFAAGSYLKFFWTEALYSRKMV